MKDEDRMRAMAKFKNKRMEKSKPESERDSGFSDGSSEHLSVIDRTEDSRSQAAPLVQGLSPTIIMNNAVLKQPGEARVCVKPWPVDVVPQPQVVFLQPVVPNTHTHTKHASQRRRHRKLLPIRKSYPRIAPHPGDNPLQSDSNRSSSSGKSSSSSQSESSSCSGAPVPETPGESDTRPESTDNRSHSHRDNRVKRFCNTYNILRSSGLLDITLRTKDLIRQNRRTQSELDRLREHTRMFLQALESGDLGVWRSLETSLQEQ
ncbi:CLOCK-interacting pacemaker [Rhinichthys klamathensis goyatoka]|uniref:CLOCK-interacting pacemaker n=1 Tax=Rhinichthys klamathensis goyatoka TaxID=3034132 RepID=UPI0024B62F1B|nr:CLOCK-interacting pacemaker [Rhinichthys klamathensis goyatoka]XP_056090354.1 CLOCK-interacting pacemaker [Rhinichthys klamathensis goyatoka]